MLVDTNIIKFFNVFIFVEKLENINEYFVYICCTQALVFLLVIKNLYADYRKGLVICTHMYNFFIDTKI